MPDVEADVEVGIVDPDGTALVERHECEPLAIARHEVQAGHDLADELVVAGSLTVEQHAAGDVHVGSVALEVQKRAVEPGEAVGIGHALILSCRPACDDAHTKKLKCLRRSPTSSTTCLIVSARCGDERGTHCRMAHIASGRGESIAWREPAATVATSSKEPV